MSADAVVHHSGSEQVPVRTVPGLPRQRRGSADGASGAPLVQRHPVRRVRRRVLCSLGWHTSVFAWAPGRGVWCNHCHTQVADG